MPIIKSAIKKLRRDNKKRLFNRAERLTVKKAIKEAKLTVSDKNISQAFSLIDKAVKKGLIKKNTAARKKSQLAKILATSGTATTETPKGKKANKPSSAKKSPKKVSK